MEALGSPDRQWQSPYTQQGDVLIKKIGKHGVFEKEYEQIPDDVKPKLGNLVLKGAMNSHALYKGKFDLLEKDNVTFIRVHEATVLDHVKDLASSERAEHHAQWIPPGEYFVDQVQERDHLLEESRAIID